MEHGAFNFDGALGVMELPCPYDVKMSGIMISLSIIPGRVFVGASGGDPRSARRKPFKFGDALLQSRWQARTRRPQWRSNSERTRGKYRDTRQTGQRCMLSRLVTQTITSMTNQPTNGPTQWCSLLVACDHVVSLSSVAWLFTHCHIFLHPLP